MPNFSKDELVIYTFSDWTRSKVPPAVVANASHRSQDLFIVPLTSKTGNLLAGGFVLAEWKSAGLNAESAVKRGLFTINDSFVRMSVGKLDSSEAESLGVLLRGLARPAALNSGQYLKGWLTASHYIGEASRQRPGKVNTDYV